MVQHALKAAGLDKDFKLDVSGGGPALEEGVPPFSQEAGQEGDSRHRCHSHEKPGCSAQLRSKHAASRCLANLTTHAQVSGELHGALMEMYGMLIENAVQFGCSNARARKVSGLEVLVRQA